MKDGPKGEPHRQERGIARVELIRTTAACLFLERGFERVTLDDIARAAKGSKSTLYESFRDKHGVFLAAMDVAVKAFKCAHPLPAPSGGSLSEVAQGVLAALLSDDGLALHRLALTEAGRFPQFSKAWSVIAVNEPQSLLADALRLNGADPALAPLFYGLAIADPLQRASLGEPLSDEELASRQQEADRLVTLSGQQTR